jgi:hypothetical protein
VKPGGACGDAGGQQVKTRLTTSDSPVRRKKPACGAQLKQATEERDALTKMDTAYPPMLADRQVDLVREVHATAAASIAEVKDGAPAAQ